MLANIKRMVYPEEVTRQLHVMAQATESSPVIDRRSNHCATLPTRHKAANGKVSVFPVPNGPNTASLVGSTVLNNVG